MIMQIRQQREFLRKQGVKEDLLKLREITEELDTDPGCVQAQITSKHTDDTQTRQNTGNPPECCKTKQKLKNIKLTKTNTDKADT